MVINKESVLWHKTHLKYSETRFINCLVINKGSVLWHKTHLKYSETCFINCVGLLTKTATDHIFCYTLGFIADIAVFKSDMALFKSDMAVFKSDFNT